MESDYRKVEGDSGGLVFYTHDGGAFVVGLQQMWLDRAGTDCQETSPGTAVAGPPPPWLRTCSASPSEGGRERASRYATNGEPTRALFDRRSLVARRDRSEGPDVFGNAGRRADVGNEWDPETIFDVLGSREVRRILALADVEPRSARELAERLDASQPTVYRRVNVCQEYDLLAETTRVDEEGNHYKVYETNLRRVCFEVEDGGYDVTISLRQDLVDRFGDFWGGLEGGGRGE